MTELPIPCTADEVRAILARAKTRISRPIKPQPPNGATEVCVEGVYGESAVTYRAFPDGGSARHAICACPFGVPGDKLWVQECWGLKTGTQSDHSSRVFYRADGADRIEYWQDDNQVPEKYGYGLSQSDKWRQSNHMPRWASRIDLLVKRAWVEQVQKIPWLDILAEGVPGVRHPTGEPMLDDFTGGCDAETTFRDYWDNIYAKRGFGWDENPWVAAAEFSLIENAKARKS
ncbi:hypothetical protein LCGC14_1414650 [marine sediment metagenome]|uniref:Uncharacterized protein n=1 Tax=marine sediment metagenome TaxID=412755 RepID=A0A0F9KEC0_9ZZZZ